MTFHEVLYMLRMDPSIVFDARDIDMLEQGLDSFEHWMMVDINRHENIRKILSTANWTYIGYRRRDGTLCRTNRWGSLE